MSFKKVLISIASLLTFLFLLGWLVLSSALFSGLRTTLTEGILTKQLGREVQVAGDLRISPGSTVGVIAEDVVLPSTSMPDTDLARLGRLAFDLSLSDLVGGKLTLSNLEADGAVFSLIVDESGTNSWQSTKEKPAKAHSASGSKPALDPWSLFADRKIGLANTKLLYLNAVTGLDLDLTLETLVVQRDAADAPLVLEGSGDLNGEALTLAANLPKDAPLTAEVSFDQVKLTASGTPISTDTPGKRSIALSANIHKLSQFLDIVKLQKPIEGTGQVSAIFTSGDGPARIDKLNVVVDLDTGQSVVVTGNIGELGNPEDVSLTTRIRLYPEDAEPPKTKSRRELKLIAVDMVIDSVPGQIAQRSMKIVTNGFTIDTQGVGPAPITVRKLSRSPDGKLRLGNVNLRIGQPENPFLILDGAVGDALKLAEVDGTGTLKLTTATLLSPLAFQDSDHLGHLAGGFKLRGNIQELALSDLKTTSQDTDLWTLSVTGSVKNVMRFQDVALNIEVDVPSSKELLEAMTLEPIEIEPVLLKMDLASQGDEWNATASVQIAESNLDLKLDLDEATAEPIVQGLVESDMIQIDHLRHIFDVVLQLRKLMPNDDVDPQQDEIPDDVPVSGPFSDVSLLPIGQAALVSGINADLEIDLRKIEGSRGLSSLHSELQLNEKELTAGPVEFQYDSIHADVTGRIDLTQSEHVLELKGSTGGWRLHEVLELIHFKKSASGTLYSNFDISGPITSARAFLSGMNGNATVSMKDGSIDTQLLDLAGLGVLPWLFTKHKDQAAPISCLRAPFAISNGRVSTQRTAVETNQVQIVVYGDVDLNGRTIDIYGQPRKIGEPLSRSPWPFSLSGSLNKPKVKVKDGPKRLKRKDGADTMPAQRKACVPDILQLQ
ncbi:AsmA-like C-terminal region-containing protein [uncultured Shimia sp.]|uniref:AsmA family protein n=1 Tax=uncultured Shimia sp. TaxID=573152 RepID=UPI0026318F04|nr:AsmA-like C-terminal region-containing protein [uncultured Shimia sp.]